jgi:ATP-dependent protease Clp ATPase subunit
VPLIRWWWTHIPSDQNIEKVVLDSSSVSGESEPLVVYSQSEAPKESSN